MSNIEAHDGKKTDVVWKLMLLPKANNNTRLMSLLKIFLRTGAVLATITATLVMGLNKQTKSTAVAVVGTNTLYQTLTAKFDHTPAFVYFVIANAVASFYNLSVLSLGFLFSKCKGYEVIVHLSDMVMMAVVATAAAAASSISELGKNGNLHARWSPICDKFDDYCHRGGLALIAAFVGAGLLVAVNAHSIIALHKNAASRL